MTRDEIQAQSLVKIRRLSRWMVIGYAIMVILAIFIITTFAISRYDNVLKEKVSTMTASLNVQMKLNLDSYLSRMETVGTLAFSVDNAYTYDAADPDNDEYEAIGTEKQISDDLYSLCLMENFVDYGIVYRNNHTVGKVSNGTTALFGDSLFNDLEGMIIRERTHDGWYTGYKNDYERIYYVKRIHDNAVFLISFYTTELEEVFDNPDTMKDMEIRLTDKSYRMIYSSGKDALGSVTPKDILLSVRDQDTATVLDENNLSTVNITNGDWYVICSIPTNIILKEAADMRKIIILIAVIAGLVAVGTGVLFIRKIADPVKTITSSLSDELREDGFEGVLARRFFNDKCSSVMVTSGANSVRSLAVFEIDNYDEILDKCGSDAAYEQLTKLNNVIREVFGQRLEEIGRTGECSFAVFTKQTDHSAGDFKALISQDSQLVCDKFREDMRTSTMGILSVTVSAGVSVYPSAAQNYGELRERAYIALSESKKQGGSICTVR